MIDYEAWAKEESDQASTVEETLKIYAPPELAPIFENRIREHKERAAFLLRMHERSKAGIW